MSINVAIAERLSRRVAAEVRAEMARKQITGRALAKMLGRSPNWVSLKTSGAQTLDLDELETFATALGVTIVDLLPRRDRGTTEPYLDDELSEALGADPVAAFRPPDNRPPGRSRASRPRDNRPPNRPRAGRTARIHHA